MSQITKQLALRLPLDLHAKVVATAAENNRSGHAEMLKRLEESFEEPARTELSTLVTTCFSKLEERVMAMLWTTHGPGGDFAGRPGTSSPTGRLSESQPELQDLPAVSGISTLAASLRKMGCMCSGGYTGDPRLKEGEVPAILSPGREWRSYPFTTGAQPPVAEPGERPQPFTGLNWVIAGSLETMTRDRAREIIMDLGGGVAGAVDGKTHALLWGPGAGSKKTRAEQLGVQQYTERQFIELIRSHGVDMPLPKEGEWIENTGSRPVERDIRVDVKFEDGGSYAAKMAGDWHWKPNADRRFNITHWRLAQ